MEFIVVSEQGNIYTGVKSIEMEKWTDMYSIGVDNEIIFRTLSRSRVEAMMDSIAYIITESLACNNILINVKKLAEHAGTPEEIKMDAEEFGN